MANGRASSAVVSVATARRPRVRRGGGTLPFGGVDAAGTADLLSNGVSARLPVTRVRPILDALARAAFRVSPPPRDGQSAELVNHAAVGGCTIAAAAEPSRSPGARLEAADCAGTCCARAPGRLSVRLIRGPGDRRSIRDQHGARWTLLRKDMALVCASAGDGQSVASITAAWRRAPSYEYAPLTGLGRLDEIRARSRSFA